MNRREFLALTAAGIASRALVPHSGNAGRDQAPQAKIKAIAFDAFPIFDPRPVFALAEELFPGNGITLSDEWRVRQFEYTWLRVVAQRYADFWQVTEDALVYAANKLKLDLTAQKREKLMSGYLNLKTWPDVPPALSSLKKSGLKLALLSNFTQHMLQANIKSAGLAGIFEEVISTDQARTFKPDPRAYQLGIESLGLQRHQILFAAFAGWDAAGARLFGYPTFWVNRLKLPPEELDAVPDASGGSLLDLVQFLGTNATSNKKVIS
ncbi:haloacetate dehalogenase [Acidobacteria bacterium SCGC AG-212-P17]|nr:haloacetate dehalogenase [Acidobacteria bacterium SCGC AG-212-P17]